MSGNSSTMCNEKTTEVNVQLLRYIMQLLTISREEVDQLLCNLKSSGVSGKQATDDNQLLRCTECSEELSYKNKVLLSSRGENSK